MSGGTRGAWAGAPAGVPDGVLPGLLAGRYRPVAGLDAEPPCVAFLAERLIGIPEHVVVTILPPAVVGAGDEPRRLQREIAALALMRHPSVLTVYECERTPDGGLYVVSERAASPSVASLLRRGPLPLADVVEIVRQCAALVHVARQLGVRNRAIRLDGVLVTRAAGGAVQVKVKDFGLPAPCAGDPGTAAAGSGDEGGLAPGADVRALAMLAIAMLGGRAALARERYGPGPLAVRPDVPADCRSVLVAALAPAPPFESAPELWAALRDAAIRHEGRAPGEPGSMVAGAGPGAPAASSAPRPPGGDPAPAADAARRSRNRRLGELLVAEGIISRTQLDVALEEQARRPTLSLGDALLERGLISEPQLGRRPPRYGRKYRLGDVLVETNTITEEQLEVALARQRECGLRVGEVLVSLDYVSRSQLRDALVKQLEMDATLELEAPSLLRDRAEPDLVAMPPAVGPGEDRGEPEGPRGVEAPGTGAPQAEHRTGGGPMAVGDAGTAQAVAGLEARFAALASEHAAAMQELRRQAEQCERLLRERQDLVDGLQRLARHLRG